MSDRMAWRGRLRAGQREEYLRLHREIWPEMAAVLREAGIRNYSIWLSGDEVFGVFEATMGLDFARRIQAGSEVARRWAETTAPLLEIERDPSTGLPVRLEEAFFQP